MGNLRTFLEQADHVIGNWRTVNLVTRVYVMRSGTIREDSVQTIWDPVFKRYVTLPYTSAKIRPANDGGQYAMGLSASGDEILVWDLWINGETGAIKESHFSGLVTRAEAEKMFAQAGIQFPKGL